jgi:hypothetical protein
MFLIPSLTPSIAMAKGYHIVSRNSEEKTSPNILSVLRRLSDSSSFWWNKLKFEQARRSVDETKSLAEGWDTYGADAPNDFARQVTAKTLTCLEAVLLVPIQVTPSVEGGIALSFVRNEKKALMEIYNTGEIVAATYTNEGDPNAWEFESSDVSSLVNAIEQIRVYLAA